jgi:hypothetical protein
MDGCYLSTTIYVIIIMSISSLITLFHHHHYTYTFSHHHHHHPLPSSSFTPTPSSSGHVGGAALDVFTSEPPKDHLRPLIAHPNLVCTPHLGR